MDKRKARREAEQAARRQLAGDLIGVIGDLAVAVAAQAERAAAIGMARDQATRLVEQARTDGRRLVDEATAAADAAADTYGATWQQCLDAGWTVDKLTDMGYPTPKRRRRNSTLSKRTNPSAAGDNLGAASDGGSSSSQNASPTPGS